MAKEPIEPVYPITLYQSSVGLPSMVAFERTGLNEPNWAPVIAHRMQRYCEILYVVGGTGRIAIQDKWYDARPHEVFFTPPGVVFDLVTQEEDRLDMLFAHFNLQDAHHYRRLSGPAPFILQEIESYNDDLTHLTMLALPDQMSLASDNSVLRYLTNAYDIYESKAPGFYQRSCALLLIALHQLFDELMSAVSEGATGSRYRTLVLARRIKSYISERPTTFSGLAELGKAFHMNSQHLSRVFKRTYDESIVSFANRVRVDASKLLLANTDKSIPDVANASGFKTTNHFQRVFRGVVGMSPLEFRSIRAVKSSPTLGLITHYDPVSVERP